MGSRWFNLAVVLLWLATMTWLLKEKVLPPLWIGEPPSYRTILAARRTEPPVGWRLALDGRPIGWALSSTKPLPNRLTEIRSRVHFDELPLAELAPGWIGTFLSLTKYRRAKLQMDTTSKLLIDPLGRLSRFDSSVRIEGVKHVVRIEGNIEDADLRLSVRAGELTYEETVRSISSDALLGDSFSPQTRLPGLREGQTWTVPTFSPLGRLDSPVEILHATVERIEPAVPGGATWLVVYRSDPGIGLGVGKRPQGKLWVRRDGTVLRQEVMIFNSRMTFLRMSGEEAAALADQVAVEELAGGTK